MGTWVGQSPSEIRTDDQVTDALGRTFVALSDAEMVAGDYVVRAWYSSDEKDLILDHDSKVTITYDESAWHPVEKDDDN
jgi:hypothetical protein